MRDDGFAAGWGTPLSPDDTRAAASPAPGAAAAAGAGVAHYSDHQRQGAGQGQALTKARHRLGACRSAAACLAPRRRRCLLLRQLGEQGIVDTIEATGPVAEAGETGGGEEGEEVWLVSGAAATACVVSAAASLVSLPAAQDGVTVAVVPAGNWASSCLRRGRGGAAAAGAGARLSFRSQPRRPRSGMAAHQERSCGSLRISYAFCTSLKTSSASARLSWFLSAS